MIDFIKAQFGVEASTLSYEEVVDYFSIVRVEGVSLEFKSFNGEKKLPDKIYQSICAMLNSAGGLIIWGSPKEVNATGTKECRGDLTPVSEKIKKEDLIRSISDRILPMPENVKVHEISRDSNSYIYLFEIHKSEYSPHQLDNRYYMRLDSETRIAPHYFIEALFKKIKYPELSGILKFLSITFLDREYQYILIVLKVIIKNNSPLQNEEYPTFTISCNAGKPLEMYEDWPPIDRFNPASIRSQDNPMKILYYGKKIEETYKIGLRTIDLNRLNDKSNKLNIFLRFGGRYSPLKFSFYVVDTSFFTSMQYCELQSYPIPTEFIQSQENNLIADSDFDLDLISDWNTLSS